MSTGFQATFDDLGWDDDKLTPAERDVWNSVETGPHGPREYARMTDRSPGTVGNLLRRARAKMGASW
jgi:DNA-binding CsgD family transcriptional regulator